MSGPLSLVVTRPQPQADAWVDALRKGGCEAEALPLIDIRACPLDAQVTQQWAQSQAVMFVSAQAVKCFFEQLAPLPSAPMTYWATGLGTRQALLAQGVAPSSIVSPAQDAAQFDSEALWALVRANMTHLQRVMIVRGRDDEDSSQAQPASEGMGRDWLGQQLRAQRVDVVYVVAYERRCPQWTAEQRQQARRWIAQEYVWLISSSQALMHLHRLMSPMALASLHCLATHPRIADKAKALGVRQVAICRPVVDDVLQWVRAKIST